MKMIKQWLYKRELERWQHELESLELTLEYCDELSEGKEQHYLDKVHECWKVIDGLKVLINRS